MSQVIYAPNAKADLQQIWDYVAEDSQMQADRLILSFRTKLQKLAGGNTLGRPRPDLCTNCRSTPFGKYCFYYRPTESGIEVLRILHSARDLGQINFLG
ncbi:type II toxin-antitoxin system RelE/ParE family toxin [Prosthecobacter sp.]|uniref:type II toxin-antitoxin system RelE/ParE family toxin n=1 Tax=Prosthecobacter sp. TaxID=1965333 RepID=UPI00378409B0